VTELRNNAAVDSEMTTNAKQDSGKHDQTPGTASAGQGIHVVTKPIGPACNLNCEYCFYLEKQALFSQGGQYRMPDDVLSAFITNYITSQPTSIVEFVWQGGEPILYWVWIFSSGSSSCRSHL
jgi:sulfatase maturation enzyme AslB (radical SAM superfamily)